MNEKTASALIEISILNLKSRNELVGKKDNISIDDIRKEIVINATIELYQKIESKIKNEKDIQNLPLDKVLLNFHLYKKRTKDYKDLEDIVHCFKKASASSLSQFDAECIEEDIYNLISNDNVVGIINKYYLENNGFIALK